MIKTKQFHPVVVLVFAVTTIYFGVRAATDFGAWKRWVSDRMTPDLDWVWQHDPLLLLVGFLVIAIIVGLFCYLFFYYGKELYVWCRLKNHGVLVAATIIELRDVKNRSGHLILYRQADFEFAIPGSNSRVKGTGDIPWGYMKDYSQGSKIGVRYDPDNLNLSRIEEPSFVDWGLRLS